MDISAKSIAPRTLQALRRSPWSIGCGTIAALMAQSMLSPAFAQPSSEREDRSGSAKVTQESATAGDGSVTQDSQSVDESYQPKGIEAGSFLFFPRVETDILYSTNVFASEDNKRDDFVHRIAPEFRLRSRFVRHELNFRGELEQYLFHEYTDDNRLDGVISSDGRLDIQRNWEATGFVSYSQRGEDRGSPDAAGGKEPTKTHTVNGLFGTRLQQGRYVFQGDVGIDRRIFEDVETSTGRTVNNSDRDRWEYRARARGSYEMYTGYSAVIDATFNRREYDDRLDDSGFNRSSEGFRLEAGVGVDISQLIKGDFVVGYFTQDYEDPRLTDPDGYAMRATFNWTPTRLTVVIPSLERSVQETVSASASSIVRTGGGVVVRHEFMRNLVATLTTNVSYDEYSGSTEDAWNYEGRARAIYAFTPEYYAGGELGIRSRDSNRAGSSYDQVTMMVRVGARI